MRTRFGTVTSLCSNVGLSAAHTVAYTQTLHTDSPHTLYSHALARNASAQTVPAGRQRLGSAARADHARTFPPPPRATRAPSLALHQRHYSMRRHAPTGARKAGLGLCVAIYRPKLAATTTRAVSSQWSEKHHAATSSPRHTVTSITIEEGNLHSAVSSELEQPLVRPGLRKPAPPERGAHLAHHRPRRTVRGG